jgi:hypothetical protein
MGIAFCGNLLKQYFVAGLGKTEVFAVTYGPFLTLGIHHSYSTPAGGQLARNEGRHIRRNLQSVMFALVNCEGTTFVQAYPNLFEAKRICKGYQRYTCFLKQGYQ